MIFFHDRVGLVQRVLPEYRAPFFNALGLACQAGLGVFAGDPRPAEMIKTTKTLDHAQLFVIKNHHIFKNQFYFCLQSGLLQAVKAWNPGILIVEANPRYLLTPSVIRWMHTQGRPVIGWGLGSPPLTGPLSRLRKRYRARYIDQFDALITYSQTGAEEYAGLGFSKERIYVAVNAVTPPPKQPLPDRPLPSKEKQLRILFVGRLQERKGLHNLLQACANLPASLQPGLIIVGDGPDLSRLEALASDVYPHATFTGALYGEALDEQYRKADLFVLPGTGGLAIQQAMSFGLPIIAAEADGTQVDLVRPGNGWQIPPNDVYALQAALEESLSNVSRLRRMGAESYRIVSDEINLEKMVAVFIQAIQESLS